MYVYMICTLTYWKSAESAKTFCCVFRTSCYSPPPTPHPPIKVDSYAHGKTSVCVCDRKQNMTLTFNLHFARRFTETTSHTRLQTVEPRYFPVVYPRRFEGKKF